MAVPPQRTLLRTASAENVSLQHPAPGLESLQGAYVKNVERLEQSAEELSQGGSDIGEEIRRMKQEQDRASRRSSMASREGRQQSISGVLSTRTRNHSTSSYANSIVDVNTAARWGGYSPGGYVTSPTTVSRVSSFRRPSGMPEPVQEGRPLDSPLTSPTSLHSPTRQPSHYSLAPTNEEMEMLDGQDGHDADKTPEPEPEPEHSGWERASRYSRDQDPDEQSHYSGERTSHYSGEQASHYSGGQASHHSREQASHYSPDQATPYSLDQATPYSLDESTHYSLADPHDQYSIQDQQSHYEIQTQRESHHSQTAQIEGYDYDQHRQSDATQPSYDYHHDGDRPATPPERPQTADTYRQARHLFKDFDGVHFSPVEEEDAMSQPRLSRQPRPFTYAQPPPNDNMVYYPAPVPRMLNLPKRLSQLPTASVQAKRRSEVLKTMPQQARQSTAWLPALDFEAPEQQQQHHDPTSPTQLPLPTSPASPHSLAAPSPQRQRRSMMDLQSSRMSTANLAPQLRASVFFGTEGAAQTDVKIQSSSAVATLDSILAASVNAPVSVFVDHPFAGPVRQEVYGPERPAKRRSATLSKLDMAIEEPEQKGHERSVSTGTVQAKPPMAKRNSVMSIFDIGNKEGKKLKKRNSKMSLTTDLDINDAATEAPRSRPASAHMALGNESVGDFASQSQQAHDQAESTVDADEDDGAVPRDDDIDMPMPFFAQPTTLLAELQTRKAHQKSRNRTAADAFPNGMHSTLLQLDAVKQVEKSKRQRERTRLAWEDPGLIAADATRDEEDEDVPLGVLYPTQQGLANKGRHKKDDWDRPLGLMEKREFEDNEPLSSRRFRLKGVSPAEATRLRQEQERQRREANLPPPEAVPLPGEKEDKEDEDADEPLAQRLRRLKQKEALNSALGDVAEGDKRKSAFADEVLGSLGGIESTKEAAPEPEEETLGQRRARLQREREAAEKQREASDPPSLRTVRPPLQASPSLANLLAANPVTAASAPRVANAPPGSLLAESAKSEEEQRRKLKERNAARSTSYNKLVGGAPPGPPQLQTAKSMNAIPQYLPQVGSQQPGMYPAHMAAGGAGAAYGYQSGFLQPGYAPGMMAGYGYGQQPAQPMPVQQQQAFAHFAQMQTPGNAMLDPSMDPAQRDLIDRWRLSIMQ